MNRILYDFEQNEVVSLATLEAEYHEAYKNGWIEPCTFNQYLSNCMYYHNGSIIPFTSEAEMKKWMEA